MCGYRLQIRVLSLSGRPRLLVAWGDGEVHATWDEVVSLFKGNVQCTCRYIHTYPMHWDHIRPRSLA